MSPCAWPLPMQASTTRMPKSTDGPPLALVVYFWLYRPDTILNESLTRALRVVCRLLAGKAAPGHGGRR